MWGGSTAVGPEAATAPDGVPDDGLCLFADDDYDEVATKVTGSLDRWGCWDASWSVPTSSAITQARKRLGAKVFAQVFEAVAKPIGGRFAEARCCATGGCWPSTGSTWTRPTAMRTRPSSGYACSGQDRSAYPKARVVALSEWGTHAFVAAEVAPYAVGEKTLARRLYPRLQADDLPVADGASTASRDSVNAPAPATTDRPAS